MTTTTTHTSEYGTTTYKSTERKAGGNIYSFIVASGVSNYISVRKETNNPYKMAGKEFKNWKEVEAHYKSADMQIAIFSAQSVLS